jgi:hypothetical protein
MSHVARTNIWNPPGSDLPALDARCIAKQSDGLGRFELFFGRKPDDMSARGLRQVGRAHEEFLEAVAQTAETSGQGDRVRRNASGRITTLSMIGLMAEFAPPPHILESIGSDAMVGPQNEVGKANYDFLKGVGSQLGGGDVDHPFRIWEETYRAAIDASSCSIMYAATPI